MVVARNSAATSSKSDFNVGGGRSGSQELLLDGAANTTPDINRGVINPPVDSVQEFKVQANSYDAEFGRTSGGVINVITKSGANEFHGLVYDFERHSYIEANNWFNNASGIPNPSFKRHQFGGNIGGPIVKNKTFFFADYEGLAKDSHSHSSPPFQRCCSAAETSRRRSLRATSELRSMIRCCVETLRTGSASALHSWQ